MPIGYTERGFARYADFTDTYGARVRVTESSAAMLDAVWVFVGAAGCGVHLNHEQARVLADALEAWLKDHEQARSLPVMMELAQETDALIQTIARRGGLGWNPMQQVAVAVDRLRAARQLLARGATDKE